MLLLWSVIVIAHIGATNYAGILVLRFLLGMAEAGVSPCSEWGHNLLKTLFSVLIHQSSDGLDLDVLQTV